MSKYVFKVKDSIEKLGKSLESIPVALEEEINQAVADVAHATYAQIVAKAQSKLNKTRLDYLKALSFNKIGENAYLISLDGDWANKVEDGWGAYNLSEVLLRSKKIVQVGTRSGLPWVQKSEDDGHKFAHVPYERQPFAKEAAGTKMGDMAEDIKKMTAVNARGRRQKLTSIFKDASGMPLEGKVAIGRSENPLLDQLVKYQKNYVNKDTGKITTQSIYINYRTVSELGEVWTHPGFGGLRAFPEAEQAVEAHIDNILKTLLF